MFYYPFLKLYIYILKPALIGGSLFMVYPEWFEKVFGAAIFAFYLFLPFFVFWLLEKKKWKVWGIGIALPALIILDTNIKHIFLALILTAIGWLLAQGILLIKKKSR